jgi:hypothetical protein
MPDTSEQQSPSGRESVPEGPNKQPEYDSGPETTPHRQVTAPAQRQRIWRTIAIISLILSLAGTFGVTAKEIFLTEPVLEPPPLDQDDPFAQPFGIKNGMSYFTMHNTCSLTFIESEYNKSSGFQGDTIYERLNDIGPGKVNYLEAAPGYFRGAPQGTDHSDSL